VTETGYHKSELQEFLARWGGPVLIALVFATLTAWTWRKWPDILIDFGRELYVPWQLLEGKVLYRDLAYLNGPFSPYLNALWFKIFGVSLTTIIFCNFIIIVFITIIIYFFVRQFSDRFTATLASIFFLCAFAFGQLAFVGNYNYVCPYSHEMTHGILLSFLLIIFLSASINRPRPGAIILAGLCLGFIFLGKGEIFLAAAGAATVGLVLLGVTNELPRKDYFLMVMLFIIAMVVPIAIALIYFTAQMPPMQALRGIAGTWAGLLESDVKNNLFYKRSMGLDHPWRNLWWMIRGFLGIGLLAGLFIAAERVSPNSRTRSWLLGLGTLSFLGVILWEKSWSPFLLFNRSLPLTLLAAAVVLAVFNLEGYRDKDKMAKLAPLAMWAVLGMGLLAKMILNARIWQYGFALAMPAAILLVVVLVGMIPASLQRWYGRGHWLRLIAVLLICSDVTFSLRYSYSYYSKKDLVIGEHGDAIKTYGTIVGPGGLAVSQLLQFIQSTIPPDATFAVLPEGVMINYLTRHLNSTPYINFMPPELIIFGETRILNAFKAQAPDFIILIHKDTKEYGADFFGTNPVYGKATMDWIRLNYTPVWQVLAEPLQDDHFGIKVMQRINLFSGNAKGPERVYLIRGSSKIFGYERLHNKGN
jgi:hypothetical protein